MSWFTIPHFLGSLPVAGKSVSVLYIATLPCKVMTNQPVVSLSGTSLFYHSTAAHVYSQQCGTRILEQMTKKNVLIQRNPSALESDNLRKELST